ncbi:MAG: LLM class flavin-dependent oxidoreductase [Gammaproteobacteria bacterium]|nr:LLM class flavin-dependent oxidoreductase [Gammaproteobacteria bacterium]MCY4277252.1 LLM class flavin-dependent oxidoreductase [Gammaproteobacteria bacterium]
MIPPKPSVSLAALPGKRQAILDLAQEIERQGFEGIYCTSLTEGLSLSLAIAMRTSAVALGTSIVPIYHRIPQEFAYSAAFVSEVSNGRFRFGIGVSHKPMLDRAGVTAGKPLADIRAFVEALRAVPRAGELPPIVLAAMRKRMIALAGEIGDGMVFANGARSHMPESLSVLSQAQRSGDDFFIGAMIPTCVCDDEAAAKAVHRRTMITYVSMTNYRNYWKEAGYEEEMTAIEAALATRDRDAVTACMSDKWLADVTLFGSAAKVREGVEAWHESGIKTIILVPSSAAGNQQVAFQELIDAYE